MKRDLWGSDDEWNRLMDECARIQKRVEEFLVMAIGTRPVDAIAHRMERA
jgi:hypothetical protein